MTQISFPNVSLESLSCDLVFPGQVTHESTYTGSQQTISRGIGRWRGVFAFPQLGRADGADNIGLIDAFFANTDGAVNTFDIPFEAISEAQKTRFPDGTDVRLTALSRTGTTMLATINQATGLRVGDRVTINNRMFIVITNLAGGQCTLSPHRPLVIPTGGLAVEWQDISLRARLIQNNPVSVLRNLDWVGPWSASFIDVL